MPEARDVVGGAASGFLSLFSASLVAKFATFASNVVIVRSVGRATLGVGTLQLDELLFMGPLVMTRDGLRKVAYRLSEDGKDSVQALINLCWLTVPVAMVLGGVGARSLWLNRPSTASGHSVKRLEPEPGLEDWRLGQAILLTLLALLLAMLQEPAFLLAQNRMDQRFRARSETLATVLKCGVILAGVLLLGGGVESFAAGNLGFAGSLCLLYFWNYGRRRRGSSKSTEASLWPRRTSSGAWWDQQAMGPAKEFWLQSLQKWVLENGEKVVMVLLGTEEQSGEYVLVANLGSIVVRLFFQPLEEMALATFGKLQALASSAGAEKAEKLGAQRALERSFSLLFRLLLLLGLLFASFGPAYSHLLLRLLYGSTWSDASSAPAVLAWYCLYILTMALNGLCEAFAQGVSSEEQLRTYNYWMVVFGLLFIFAVMVLMPYGAVGLVLANILKMICRIAVCLRWYILPVLTQGAQHGGSARRTLLSLLPSPAVLGAFLVSFVATQASLALLYQAALRPPQAAAGDADIAGDIDQTLFSSSSASSASSSSSSSSSSSPSMTLLELAPIAAKHVFVGLVCLASLASAIWRHHGRELLRDIKDLRGR